jgi:hypothetical protein
LSQFNAKNRLYRYPNTNPGIIKPSAKIFHVIKLNSKRDTRSLTRSTPTDHFARSFCSGSCNASLNYDTSPWRDSFPETTISFRAPKCDDAVPSCLASAPPVTSNASSRVLQQNNSQYLGQLTAVPTQFHRISQGYPHVSWSSVATSISLKPCLDLSRLSYGFWTSSVEFREQTRRQTSDH